jgi:hypothetical protein
LISKIVLLGRVKSNAKFLQTSIMRRQRKNKYLLKSDTSKFFFTKKKKISILLKTDKKQNYSIKNIKSLTSCSKQLLMLQKKSLFYKVFNQNIFNYYV